MRRAIRLLNIHYSLFNIKLAPAISRGAFGGIGGSRRLRLTLGVRLTPPLTSQKTNIRLRVSRTFVLLVESGVESRSTPSSRP